jgi:hypothetical protein
VGTGDRDEQLSGNPQAELECYPDLNALQSLFKRVSEESNAPPDGLREILAGTGARRLGALLEEPEVRAKTYPCPVG